VKAFQKERERDRERSLLFPFWCLLLPPIFPSLSLSLSLSIYTTPPSPFSPARNKKPHTYVARSFQLIVIDEILPNLIEIAAMGKSSNIAIGGATCKFLNIGGPGETVPEKGQHQQRQKGDEKRCKEKEVK
jgi:hypothetical protein